MNDKHQIQMYGHLWEGRSGMNMGPLAIFVMFY